MTEITRSVEILAPQDKVWAQIEPSKWTEIFDFVREIDGYTEGKPGVGTKAKVVAGQDDISTIEYYVEITEYKENEKIAYRRYGGPLPGKSVITLTKLHNGTLLTRSNQYEDDLSQDTLNALSAGLEKDNLKIKRTIEARR